MPIRIDCRTDAVATLADLVDHCRSVAFDPGDRDSLIEAAPILAALGNDRRFLADHAVEALKDACRTEALANGYSPQVLMLSPPDGRFLIRANIWPSPADPMLRDSSPAAYFYNRPHDHAFDFLTLGYAGPGYWSDYYEYDGAVQGVAGEAVELTFTGRSRLESDAMLLYRANRDIHDQLPPDGLSVSINLMPMTEAQAWRRQYFFDLAGRRVMDCQTITGAELLLPLAVRFGGGTAEELARHVLATHDDPRMRLAAWRALLSHGSDEARGHALAVGEVADCAVVRSHARHLLARSETEGITL